MRGSLPADTLKAADNNLLQFIRRAKTLQMSRYATNRKTDLQRVLTQPRPLSNAPLWVCENVLIYLATVADYLFALLAEPFFR